MRTIAVYGYITRYRRKIKGIRFQPKMNIWRSTNWNVEISFICQLVGCVRTPSSSWNWWNWLLMFRPDWNISSKMLHPLIYLCKQRAQKQTVVYIPSRIKLKSNLQLSAKWFKVFANFFLFTNLVDWSVWYAVVYLKAMRSCEESKSVQTPGYWNANMFRVLCPMFQKMTTVYMHFSRVSIAQLSCRSTERRLKK